MTDHNTVLLVDDSAADRALFRTILSRGGFTVFEASRGDEALARAREVRPHIIVLDVNLPEVDGLEVCRLLRADRQVGSIPVLMLTVRHDDRDVIAGLEAGADDYVPKDSAPELVLARVNRLVQFRQLANLAVLNRQLAQVGRLLAGIIHEIRGPLAVIRGSAELLRSSFESPLGEAQWVDAIIRGCQMLQMRLEHLMAAVRSGPAQPQSVEVVPLLNEAVELFLKGLPPTGRRLQVHVVPICTAATVRADAGRLIQVLIDLLSNAHQALATHDTGGEIQLRCRAAEAEGGRWVLVEVSDDGPGIPDIYLERIFEPFFTTKEEGTGYGLYLASEIVKEQGGRIAACNNSEGGACFTIWLPGDTSSRAEAPLVTPSVPGDPTSA
jgi:signal transduction histidine kinase